MRKTHKSDNKQDQKRENTIRFLREIGLEIVVDSKSRGFLSTCRIVDGTLHIRLDCPVSDILHEAGHMAIVPTVFRIGLQDNVETHIADIFKNHLGELDPDHPLYRALIQCGDTEATAWAWAAGLAIGLAPEEIIEDEQYDHAGDQQRLMLSLGSHYGINGLKHAGMCNLPQKLGSSILRPEPGFPAMKKWLQNADFNQPAPEREVERMTF